MALANVCGETYHINNGLQRKWDKIKDGALKKIDTDKLYIVDGRERTGKSVFAMQQACYIDPTLIKDLSRICFTADEFLEAIRKTDSDDKTTRCVIFDEAFRGLSSRGAMSKVNKKIVQALMEVGQKNLVIWIVLPSFFMLDLYVSMLRSNALFHISIDNKNKKRVFHVYPYKKKGILYQVGIRKGWSYDIRTNNRGYFYNKFPANVESEEIKAFYKAYLKKKRQSLTEDEEIAQNFEYVDEKSNHLDKMADKLSKDGFSTRQIAKKLKEEFGIEVSQPTIVKSLQKTRAQAEYVIKKAIYMREKSEKSIID